MSSAYNVIKTTKSSAEIIYAKEYNYSDYSVGNSYACRSIGTDAFQWGVFHPGGDVLYNVIFCLTDMTLMIFEDMRNSSSLRNIPMLQERLIL